MPRGRFPVSPYWSSNPNIPIFLENGEERNVRTESDTHVGAHEQQHSRHAPEYICPTCETSSRDTPIHCVSISPAPPSYSSIAPPAPSPRHLTVPILTVETPRNWSKPQAPNRSLQFDPEGRPNVRFRRTAFSPLSPATTNLDDIDWRRKSQIGLGIAETPFRPDTSPITPGTAEKRGEDLSSDIRGASNLAQRIEQKLWKYSASRNVVKRWLIEIISWSLSAACMAGIIIMLARYQSRRIPKWPLGLTLNAYISVLSKVASAALLLPVSEALGQLKWSWFHSAKSKKMWDFELFDNASRGPWGSLLLLVRTKGRTLAALGAAVTLFAMALDPFFQQVVEYPEHWRLQEGRGQIPKAFGYQPFISGEVFQANFALLQVDMAMTGVTYRYFYNDGIPPVPFGKGVRAEVPLGCPNSNCTWPEYETFGVHSECVDASDRVEFRCHYGKLDWIQDPTTDPNQTNDATYPNGTACGWWLKADKNILMTGYEVGLRPRGGQTLLVRTEPLYDLYSRDFMPGYKPHLNNSRNPLAHGVIVSGRDLEHVHQNATPIVHECMISWAAKTIQSSYSEGGYTEDIVDTVINSTVGESPWLTTVIPNDNPSLVLYDYKYLENVTVVGHQGTYGMDNITHSATVAIFDDIFPGTFVHANDTNLLRYKFYNTINPYTRNMTFNPWLYENITDHLDNLAASMTNVMRSAAKEATTVEGSAFDLESIVDVRWWWMTLPLSLLTVTGIFLLATIFRSSNEHEHVGVWKTSAMATLLYGLPDDMSKKLKSSQEHSTPRARAKEVNVKWVPKRGWRFSGSSISPTSFRGSVFRRSASPISAKGDHSPVPQKARQSPPTNPREGWL